MPYKWRNDCVDLYYMDGYQYQYQCLKRYECTPSRMDGYQYQCLKQNEYRPLCMDGYQLPLQIGTHSRSSISIQRYCHVALPVPLQYGIQMQLCFRVWCGYMQYTIHSCNSTVIHDMQVHV